MALRTNLRLSTKQAFLLAIFVLPLLLTGCLSHWFLESTTRLQVENATSEFTIKGVDVLAEDGSVRNWIKEQVLPGERSHVVEEDWVGDFTLRIRYTKSMDGSGEVLKDEQPFDLEGGSLYLTIESKGNQLTYRFK